MLQKSKGRIVVMRGRCVLHPKRTEYGKKIRKAYENHEISEKRKNIQQYEPRKDGLCNTITTVQKDNLTIARVDKMSVEQMKIDDFPVEFDENQPHIVAVEKRKIYECSNDLQEKLKGEEYKENAEKTIDDYLFTDSNDEQWGIFKLTPRECGRLMCVRDKDIDAILSVNSNSQAYKQFGNSICVNVLMGIFSQLGIKGVKPWNEMTEDERYQLITDGCVLGECVEETD